MSRRLYSNCPPQRYIQRRYAEATAGATPKRRGCAGQSVAPKVAPSPPSPLRLGLILSVQRWPKWERRVLAVIVVAVVVALGAAVQRPRPASHGAPAAHLRLPAPPSTDSPEPTGTRQRAAELRERISYWQEQGVSPDAPHLQWAYAELERMVPETPEAWRPFDELQQSASGAR